MERGQKHLGFRCILRLAVAGFREGVFVGCEEKRIRDEAKALA